MFTQMDAVCHRFEELSIRLNQPDTAADPALGPAAVFGFQ